MEDRIELDSLDREILAQLQKNSRKSFQEIARELNISGGTVHIRVNKMKEQGIITGSRIIIDPTKLGYDVTAYVGINLHNAGDSEKVIARLKDIREIVESHYTTGNYSLFIKVMTRTTEGLHDFLVHKLQIIPEIQSTETFVSLEKSIDREVPVL